MISGSRARIVGACLVGVALVAGAFAINYLNRLSGSGSAANPASVSTVTETRAPITVLDSDNDGLEDWQEPFLTAEPVILDDGGDYEPGDTLTEQFSVKFMESIMLSRAFGASGQNNQELVSKSLAQAQAAAQDVLYTERDITLIEDSSEAVKNYANSAANIITLNDIKGLRNEMLILQDAMEKNDPVYTEQLKQIADMYAKNRDEIRALPTPRSFQNEHLALINAFHVLAGDIATMAEVNSDPLKALIRLQNYQANAEKLGNALVAMGTKLTSYPSLFTVNDPGIIFASLNPDRTQ